MVGTYTYVRFKWWEPIDLEEVRKDLSRFFSVEMHRRPRDKREIALSDERDELQVKADTLSAMLSRFRAVLYQKESAPFTTRDMELRNKVLELYPRDRSTPFPWGFSSEPKFETVK